jgi:dienelactone hydrolase
MPTTPRRVLAAVISALLVLGLTASATAGEAPAPPDGVGVTLAQPAETAGNGRGADRRPPGAGQPGDPEDPEEPVDPDPGESDPEGWTATSTGIGGTSRYDGGEWVHQDFVYDDGERADNAADIVELRVRPDGDDLLVRVTFNTLRETDDTVLGVGVGTAGSETRDWPHGAGVASPWDSFATIVANHEEGSGLTGHPDGDALPLDPEVDLDDNTVEVRLPDVAAGDPVLTLSAGAGLWDGEAGTWTGSTPVVDLAFNGHDQEPTGSNFRSGAQRAAVESGDVSGMTGEVDVARLRAGDTDEPITTPGLYNAVFETRQDLGGGYGGSFPKHRGQYQPYALWLPKGFSLDEPTPLTLMLHSLGQIHNQYNGGTYYTALGDALGAVVVTPLALGTDGWYRHEALVDTLEVWVDATRRFNIDPERVYSSGYSMGGYGTYRLGTIVPELLAAGVSWVGPPINGIWTGVGQDAPGLTYHQLENTNHVPFFIVHGTNDELVPVTGVTMQAERFRELGHEYRYALHPGQDHFTFAVINDWTRERDWLMGRSRVTDPARVTFKVRPESWVLTNRGDAEVIRRHLDDLLAELGAALDSSYWVHDVTVADGSDVTGYVDLTSHGVAHRVPVLREVGPSVVVPGSSPHVMTGQDRHFAWAATDNLLSGSITDVTELTVDLAHAGLSLDGLVLDIGTDGPVTLHLVDGDRTETVVLGGSGGGE